MKRKFLIFLLTAVSTICLAVGLTACGGSGGNSGLSSGTEQSGTGGGETEGSGNAEENVPTVHIHNCTHTAEVEATCTTDGNIEYWYCSGCDKYFSDEACTNEITTSVTISATGHDATHFGYNAATCTENGNIEYWYCNDCGKYFSNEFCTNEITGIVISATGHTLIHIEKKSATFTDAGNIEYWYCSDCGSYYSDEACTNEITLSDTVLAALGSNISAGSDYYEDDTSVSYRYSYSITIDDDQFLLYVLAVGSDDSYSLTYKTGTIAYIEEYDVYRLDYANGENSEYIKIDNSGFYFCNADGTKDESKTEIEREGSGETAVDITPRTGNSSYGYYDLAYETNGADMQSLYYQMYTVCEAFTSNTDDVAETDGLYVISFIYLNNYSLTAMEVVSVWKVFYLENPMYYWLSNTCTILGNALYLCIDEEYANYTNRQTYDAEISAMITEACEIVAQESTELEKAIAIHDYIIGKIDYAYQSDGITPETAIWAHNITGVSSKGYGVCEAYAKTYLALCLINGLNCIIVSGYASGEGHAWNLVNIDDIWYGVDCTWDDTGTSNVSYTCFGMSASTIASSRTTDSHNEYGIDYLYELPEISGYGIQLVTLYKGDTSLGMFVNIDAAFAAMTDATADYIIELFSYSYSGALLLSAPEILHYIYSDYTPAVNSITINGIKTDYGNGYFSTTPLYLESKLTLNCNLEISNISLVATNLDLSEYTLTTSGYYCQLNGKIYDNKITDAISIKANTSYQTEIYANLDISYYLGYASLRSDANIITYIGFLNISGFGLFANINIDNYIIEDDIEYGIWLQLANLKIKNLYCQNACINDNCIFITLQFDKIEEYPHLYIGDLNVQINLNLFGAISYITTDSEGNILNSWTETADPYNLTCPIATLGNAEDFKNILIYFDTDRTNLYGLNENNEIVCTVEIVNDYFYIKDGVLLSYAGEDSTIVIPDEVTVIGDYAFYSNDSVVTVTMPDGTTSIGASAFKFCTSLEVINIPSNVISIGNDAFNYCISLINITIGENVSTIGDRAFNACFSLTSVIIPDKVETIGMAAFYGCYSLTIVTIGNSVNSINSNAFYDCYKLVEVYNLSSLKIITGSYDYGFVGYYAKNIYTSLDVESEIFVQEDYLFVCDSNFNYFLIGYNGNDNELVLPTLIINGITTNYSINNGAFYYNRALTKITIPYGVTSIGDKAFCNCNFLTTIKIPDSITYIGNDAFLNCYSLKSISIPNGMSIIDITSFGYCSSISYITIPKSVTFIGANVFSTCISLTNVYYYGTEEEWSEINIGSNNEYLTSATIYYYSETQPAGSGNYWHYVDGEIVVWTN